MSRIRSLVADVLLACGVVLLIPFVIMLLGLPVAAIAKALELAVGRL